MRYTVGQVYVFATVRFRGREAGDFLFDPRRHTLEGIDLVKLTCTEHHKVVVEYYEKDGPKADGFVFVDEQDRTWHNQYPTAYYGQLDDSNDRQVRLHLNLKDTDEAPGRDSTDSNDWMFGRRDAMSMLGTIASAIQDESLPEDLRTGLKPYLEQFKQAVEAVLGGEIEIKPWVATYNDGTTRVIDKIQIARLKEAA